MLTHYLMYEFRFVPTNLLAQTSLVHASSDLRMNPSVAGVLLYAILLAVACYVIYVPGECCMDSAEWCFVVKVMREIQ